VRRRTVRILLVAFGAVFALLFVAPAAIAHPLGNFTVNRGSAIRLTPGVAEVDYTIDMAEIPTYQELPAIDLDGDGVASAGPAHLACKRHARGRMDCDRLARDDGERGSLRTNSSAPVVRCDN